MTLEQGIYTSKLELGNFHDGKDNENKENSDNTGNADNNENSPSYYDKLKRLFYFITSLLLLITFTVLLFQISEENTLLNSDDLLVIKNNGKIYTITSSGVKFWKEDKEITELSSDIFVSPDNKFIYYKMKNKFSYWKKFHVDDVEKEVKSNALTIGSSFCENSRDKVLFYSKSQDNSIYYCNKCRRFPENLNTNCSNFTCPKLLHFSNDGKRLFYQCNNSEVYVKHLKINTLKNESSICAGEEDFNLNLYTKEKPDEALYLHKDTPNIIANVFLISPVDEKVVAFKLDKSNIKIYFIKDKKETEIKSDKFDSVKHISFSKDGSKIFFIAQIKRQDETRNIEYSFYTIDYGKKSVVSIKNFVLPSKEE